MDPSSTQQHQSRRLWVFRITRGVGLLVAIALFVWQRERVIAAGTILAEGNPLAWAIAALLQFLSIIFASFRFSFLLRSVQKPIPFASIYADLVCTVALNAALLMGVGDLYRMRQTNVHVGNLALTTSLIVLDRIIGFAIVCSVALTAMLWVGSSGFSLHNAILWIGLISLGAAFVLIRRLAQTKQTSIWVDIKRPFAALFARPQMGLYALFMSLGVSLLWLASIVIVSRGLGISVGIAPIVFAASAVTVATILPISVGGIGVREAGYAYLLASHGVSTSQAIALGVAQYALLLPVIVAGAMLAVVRKNRNATE